VFLRTDTHLNDFGNAIAASTIVERLIGEPQNEHLKYMLEGIDIETE